MDANPPPTISSFVVRFVVENTPKNGHPPYHGAIRHIQTDEEMNFNTWEDAVAFIRRFVPLEPENGAGNA